MVGDSLSILERIKIKICEVVIRNGWWYLFFKVFVTTWTGFVEGFNETNVSEVVEKDAIDTEDEFYGTDVV